jgi:WD40 repeat protein
MQETNTFREVLLPKINNKIVKKILIFDPVISLYELGPEKNNEKTVIVLGYNDSTFEIHSYFNFKENVIIKTQHIDNKLINLSDITCVNSLSRDLSPSKSYTITCGNNSGKPIIIIYDFEEFNHQTSNSTMSGGRHVKFNEDIHKNIDFTCISYVDINPKCTKSKIYLIAGARNGFSYVIDLNSGEQCYTIIPLSNEVLFSLSTLIIKSTEFEDNDRKSIKFHVAQKELSSILVTGNFLGKIDVYELKESSYRFITRMSKELFNSIIYSLATFNNAIADSESPIVISGNRLIRKMSLNKEIILSLFYYSICLIPISFNIITTYSLFSLGNSDMTVRLWSLVSFTQLTVLRSHTAAIMKVMIKESDKFGPLIYSSSQDKTVKVWDLLTLTLIETLSGHSSTINSLAIYEFTSKGKTNNKNDLNGFPIVFTCSDDGRVIKYCTCSSDLVRSLQYSHGPGFSVGISTNEEESQITIYTGHDIQSAERLKTSNGFKGLACRWDLGTGVYKEHLKGVHKSGILALSLSTKYDLIVTTSFSDSFATLWKLSTGEILHKLVGENSNNDKGYGSIQLHELNSDLLICVAGGTGKIVTWEILSLGTSDDILTNIWTDVDEINEIGKSESIKIHEIEIDYSMIIEIINDNGAIRALELLKTKNDRNLILCGTRDEHFCIIEILKESKKNVLTYNILFQTKKLGSYVDCVIPFITKNESELFCCGCLDGIIKIYGQNKKENYNDLIVINELIYTASVKCIKAAYIYDSPVIISGYTNGSILIWDITKRNGSVIACLEGHVGVIMELDVLNSDIWFDPIMVSIGVDAKINIWDLYSLTCIRSEVIYPSFTFGNVQRSFDLDYNSFGSEKEDKNKDISIAWPRMYKLFQKHGSSILYSRFFFYVLENDSCYRQDFFKHFLLHQPLAVLKRQNYVNEFGISESSSLIEIAIIKQEEVCLHLIIRAWILLLNDNTNTNIFSVHKIHISLVLSVEVLKQLSERHPSEYFFLISKLKLVQSHENNTINCKRAGLKGDEYYIKSCSSSSRNNLWSDYVKSINQVETSSVELHTFPVSAYILPLCNSSHNDMLQSYIDVSEITNDISIFNSDIVFWSIYYSWESHGVKIHRKEGIKYILYIFFFTASAMFTSLADYKIHDNYEWLIIIFNGQSVNFIVFFAIALQILVICFALHYLYEELNQYLFEKNNANLSHRLAFYHHFGDIWNISDAIAYLGTLIGIILRFTNNDELGRSILAISSISQLFKCLYFLRAYKSFGPLVSMIINTAFDIRFFLTILSLLLFGFGQSFWILSFHDENNPFGSPYSALLSSVAYMLVGGDYEFNISSG